MRKSAERGLDVVHGLQRGMNEIYSGHTDMHTDP